MTTLPASEEEILKTWPDIFARKASGKKWELYRHIEYITKKIVPAIQRGNARIVISVPPRHGKSEFLSYWFLIWFLETNPEKRIIIASYAAELAESFGRKIRNEMSSNPFIKNKLRQDSQAAHRFDTKLGGGLIAAGVAGSITGKGAHLFVIDDPYKDKLQAFSETYRRNLVGWYESVARTRLEPGGSMILIMTRWHEDDLAAHLIKTQNFEEIRLPAIAEENDPLGRKPGEALCPERYDIEALEKLKKDTGSYTWSALFQQAPVPIKGGMFKRIWWKRYREKPNFLMVKQYWDTASVPGVTNDYSVCATWGFTQTDRYLIDLWCEQVEAPQLYEAIETLAYTHKANKVVIENKGSGIGAIQYIRQKTAIAVVAYDPGKVDKQVRAAAATPTVEAGKCHLPIDAPWVEEFILEHEKFPNVAHDDKVDTTSMMIAEHQNIIIQPRARGLG